MIEKHSRVEASRWEDRWSVTRRQNVRIRVMRVVRAATSRPWRPRGVPTPIS